MFVHIFVVLVHPILSQPHKRFKDVFVIDKAVLPAVMPPAATFTYSILQLFAKGVDSNCRHGEFFFLCKNICEDAVCQRQIAFKGEA